MSQLQVPDDLTLPCFVYGLLKPGELAFGRVQPFLSDEPTIATVRGSLWIRDGLPLLDLDGSERVAGHLMRFRPDKAGDAYRAICEFEPKAQYKWMRVRVLDSGIEANALAGRKVQVGADRAEFGHWSSAEDPVFMDGLAEVRKVLRANDREFAQRDWGRMFRLQMAYLLLWSAIERYTALAYGPGLKPLERIDGLGKDPLFVGALRATVSRNDQVVDSRGPDDSYELNASEPVSSAKYFYQVRNNLSHRGKGAYSDGEKVHLALRDLLALFEKMLKAAHST